MNASSLSTENTPKTDLLDELFCLVNCGFLSDLPLRENREKLHAALVGLSPEAFTTKAWEEAIQYICGGEESFETAGQAREYLLGRTQQP